MVKTFGLSVRTAFVGTRTKLFLRTLMCPLQWPLTALLVVVVCRVLMLLAE